MRYIQHNQHKKHTRLKGMTVVLLFVIAQVLGIFHLVEHSIEGDNDGCDICASVAHADTYTVPEPVQLILPAKIAQPITDTVAIYCYHSCSPAYSSRAPPASA